MRINRTITAIGNPKICNELKDYNINIVSNDIQYKEGILEYLENNSKIDYVIINEEIPGNLKTNELVFNIKKINKKIKIILISNSDEKIYVFKKIKEPNIRKIVETINNENVFIKKQIPINDFFYEKTKESKIITILGTNGIGKSVFSIAYAKKQVNKKVLIVDFDILNINIHRLFIKKEIIQKSVNDFYNQINVKKRIIHSEKNIDFLSGINMILNSKNQTSPSKVKKIIKTLKKEYDLILIDTSTDSLLDFTKELLNISNIAIFISGANILEVKKTKRLLEIYDKEWKIKNDKINIIFNKYSDNSIDDEVLRLSFRNYNILGKIKLNEYYDLAINKRLDNISVIEKEIETIQNNIKKKLKIKKRRRKYGIS